jgi:para-nitrobenzyl esterase
VTLNYRLGAFGWLAIKNSSGTPLGNGNFGFLDQQLALKWVQNYISYFGGDPARVTLFGQSAGAISVTAHLVSPGSMGMYKEEEEEAEAEAEE